MDFTEFIEWYLTENELDYNHIIRDGDDKNDYFHCINPLISENVNSMQIYTDGWCQSWNGDIDGRSRVHLKYICKQTGFLKEYIEFVLLENNITQIKFNKFKELIVKKLLRENYNFKQFNKFRKLFKSVNIYESDIINIDTIKKTNIDKFSVKNRKKKRKSEIIELELNAREYSECLAYLKNRKLSLIKGKIEPIKLKFSSGFEIISIAIRYANGFTKYRMLQEGFRYVSKGSFKELFIVKEVEDNKIAIVGEGEFEMESLIKVCPYSIYAMHNCNSIVDLDFLERHERIIVLLDGDSYYKNLNGLRKKLKDRFPDKKINVIRKLSKSETREIALENNVELKKVDYNWLLSKNIENFNKISKKKLDFLSKI